MQYKLPRNLRCQHCVLQWYWASANSCNPPGIVDYYQGRNKPRWPPCRGQGGAVIGYVKNQRSCGGNRFPEEYWQCADVSIVGGGSRSNTNRMVSDDGDGDGDDMNIDGVNEFAIEELEGLNDEEEGAEKLVDQRIGSDSQDQCD